MEEKTGGGSVSVIEESWEFPTSETSHENRSHNVQRRPDNFLKYLTPILVAQTLFGARPFSVSGCPFSLVGIFFFLCILSSALYVLVVLFSGLVDLFTEQGAFGKYTAIVTTYLSSLLAFLFTFLTFLYRTPRLNRVFQSLEKIRLRSYSNVWKISLLCYTVLTIWLLSSIGIMITFMVFVIPASPLIVIMDMVIVCASLSILATVAGYMLVGTLLSGAFDEHRKSLRGSNLSWEEISFHKNAYFRLVTLTDEPKVLSLILSNQKTPPSLKWTTLTNQRAMIDQCYAITVGGVLSFMLLTFIFGFFAMVKQNFYLDSTNGLISFNVSLAIFVFLGYTRTAIHVNAISRKIRKDLIELEIGDAKRKYLVDRFLQIALDPGWGLTMARFFPINKSAVLTLSGLAFTILVMWIQFSQGAELKQCFCPLFNSSINYTVLQTDIHI